MEFVVVLAEAFAHFVVEIAHLLARILASVVAFVFLALTRGLSAANEAHHTSNQTPSRSPKNAPAQQHFDESRPPADSHVVPVRRKSSRTTMTLILGLTVILGLAATSAVERQIRARRIAETRASLNRLSNQLAQQPDVDVDPLPTKRVLPERDAWGQPMILSVSTGLLGTDFNIRSSGPDRKDGTHDDLAATHFVPAKVRHVGGELVKRGWSRIRERVTRRNPDKH